MRIFSTVVSFLMIPLALSAFSWDPVPPCQPMFLRVSYDTIDAAHTMAVTWNTKDECQTEIMYGKSGNLQENVKGTHFKGNEGLGYIHEVHLTNLDPESLYNYTAGDGVNWSLPHTFRTGSLPNSCTQVVFAVASDSRIESIGSTRPDKWANIVTQIFGNPDVDFIVNGGDFVHDGNEIIEWQDFLDTTPAAIMASKQFMYVLGNHDDGPGEGETANYNQLFAYPKNSVTESEDNYYFRYGPVLILSLSTATFTERFNETAQWMSDVFETEADAQWKIVFNHHPFYSSAGAGINDNLGIAHEPNEMGQNPVFIPVFDKYHVDVVISAHSHYYERFSPSYGYPGFDENKDIEPTVVDSPDKGTIYMVSGGGGAMTYTTTLVDLMCGIGAIAGSQSCGGKNHFLLFRIENNELHMETWNTSQQMDGVDPTDHKITDFLDIVKPFVACTETGDIPDEDVTDDDEVSDEDSIIETPDETSDTPETVDEGADESAAVDDTPAKTDADQTKNDDTNIPQSTNSEGCTLIVI